MNLKSAFLLINVTGGSMFLDLLKVNRCFGKIQMLWRFLFLLQHLSLLISFVIFNSVNLFCNFKFLTFHHQIMAITDEINFQFILFFNFYMTSIKLYMFTLLRLIRLTSSWKDPCGSTGQESSWFYSYPWKICLTCDDHYP